LSLSAMAYAPLRYDLSQERESDIALPY